MPGLARSSDPEGPLSDRCRAPRSEPLSEAAPAHEADVEQAPEASSGKELAPTTAPAPAEREGELAEIVLGGPPERFVQLGVRVRAGFDQRLDDLVYQFRRDGVRTSKAELVELLLFELPETPDNDLRARLAAFRRHAPRLGL